jgi:hypothetical protein
MWRYVSHPSTKDVIHEFDRASIAKCESYFKEEPTRFLGCLRIMSGIRAISTYFNSHSHEKVSIDRHDSNVVEETLQKYPSRQCRIDTMIAGLFAESRPACWYHG